MKEFSKLAVLEELWIKNFKSLKELQDEHALKTNNRCRG